MRFGSASARLHPLLAEADLCLLASQAVGWSGGPWKNLGAGGDALDAIVEASPDYLAMGDVPDDIEDAEVTSPAFYKTVANPDVGVTKEARMFTVDGSSLTASASESFAVTTAFTPLYIDPNSVRFLWKYGNSSLPPSGVGLVIEDVREIPHGPYPHTYPLHAHLIAAAKESGTAVYKGHVVHEWTHTREVVTMNCDRDRGVMEVWHNGAKISSGSVDEDLTGLGAFIDGSDLYIGAGQACHAVTWHSRALVDTEPVTLHGLLGA